jgi:formyltetrahydrofolate deformylase
MENYILKISCTDRKGLVHQISGVLYQHEFNVLETAEFVDRESGWFFMRAEALGSAQCDVAAELRPLLPPDALISWKKKHRKKVVILATKEYHCLGDLLLRHRFGDLNADILAVISNHNSLAELTAKFDIPFHYLSHQGMERLEHENSILNIIDNYQPQYLILARYMRVLSPLFIKAWEGRIINIHHSFLPAFIGANPYRQAFDRGVKIIGATAHFVSNVLDEGPIIRQDVSYVDHKRSPKELAQAGRYLEVSVLSKALDDVLHDRVFVHLNKTIIFD